MSLGTLVRPRPRMCSALDPAAQADLDDLSRRLEVFYNSAATKRYYEIAETTNVAWTPALKGPWDLAHRVPKGAAVLDLGCGSAPIYRHMREAAPKYTGVDWSREQMAVNQQRFPEAEFVAGSLYDPPLGDRRFDVVISTFVVEHLVRAYLLLDQMLLRAKPGGLIAVLTPPFRHGEYLKSFPYGFAAIPFAEKVKTGKWIDALVHTYQHRIAYPRWLRANRPRGTARGRFLIHLDPVVLNGAEFFPDSDAVYMSDTAEMQDYLAERGATPVLHWPEWGYVVMRAAG